MLPLSFLKSEAPITQQWCWIPCLSSSPRKSSWGTGSPSLDSWYQMTAAMKLKRRLFLGKKAMTNLGSVWKSRDITLPTKVHIVKAMVFPAVMYRWRSRTIKNAEHWKTDAFELWCWRRLLRGPWTARRSNQSILKEINPEYSLEGLMAEAEAVTLWLPDVKSWLTGKDPHAGKHWRQKGMTEDEMVGWHHWLNGHAAATAKLLQSCPTLCDPMDSSPPGSSVPGILQARITGVGCHFLLQCTHAC